MITRWEPNTDSKRMKEIFRHISSFFAVAACLSGMAAGLSGCNGHDPDGADGDNYMLVLHISPVNVGETRSGAGPVEKIRSLRFVVLNDGTIEYNRLVTLDDPETVPASLFRYDLNLPTTAGKKKIFLFANEESVEGIRFQTEASSSPLPDGLQDETDLTLTDLLDRFGTGEGSTPGEFVRVLEAAYFAPDYTPDEAGGVYLPYVSRYDGIEAERGMVKTVSMYLVPVATKFSFKFTNHRENEVSINRITVSSTDSQNFLEARVGDGDLSKTFTDDGKEYYWIDWLAKVSEASHANTGYYENENFNTRYGWISDYAMPGTTVSAPADLVGGTGGASESVPAMDKEEEIPGELLLGPYYLPESRNAAESTAGDPDAASTAQAYYLTLGMHDVSQEEGKDPVFDKVVISNLKSLFRNTSVVIRVTLKQGDVEVYAEIQDWNKKYASGWVTGGDDSAPLSDNPTN